MSKKKQTWDNYKEKVAKKRRNDKGAAAAAGGSDGITVQRLSSPASLIRRSRVTGHRSRVANNICKLIMSFQKNRFHNYDLKSEITGQSG